MILGEFRVGEDIAIALDATADVVAQASTVTAIMQACAGDKQFVPTPGSDPIEMTVTVRPTPVGNIPAGWTFSLNASQTAGLEAQLYGIDAKIDFSGVIEMTERTAFVSLTRATTS